MLLVFIRALFVLVTAGVAVRTAKIVGSIGLPTPTSCFSRIMLAAVVAVLADLFTPRKRIQTISAIYIGLIVGVFLTDLLGDALQPTLELYLDPRVHMMCLRFMMIFICFICISTLLQTKDDFRFIIPYVEFSKEVKGAAPLVLDTSVVIDGRIADVAETRVIDQPTCDSPLRAPRAPEHRRQLGQATAEPRSPRARHSQSTSKVAGHRGSYS